MAARDVRSKPYTSQDIRFTTKADAIYAIFLDWPADGKITVKSFAAGGAQAPARLSNEIAGVSLLGSDQKLAWTRDGGGLHVALPDARPGNDAYSLKVSLR